LKEYDDGIWRYIRAGRDIWGRPVYAAYLLGRFTGYRYRRTRREIERIRRQVYGGARVGIPTWVGCPEWAVLV